MNVLDLTGPIEPDMWSYGCPLPSIEVEKIAALHKEGWRGHRLGLHTLAGTYIETADHLFPDRETISEVSVERFVARAWVAQLEEKNELDTISPADLEACIGDELRPGDALLVSTGWDRNWNKPGFVERTPYFLPETMQWVVERDVSILGLDIPCVQDPRNDNGELNRLFFAKNRLLLAPLINLRLAGKGPFTLVALPLKISGVCGTPCRAILLESHISHHQEVHGGEEP